MTDYAVNADTGEVEDTLSREGFERHVALVAAGLRDDRLLREAAPKLLAALKGLLLPEPECHLCDSCAPDACPEHSSEIAARWEAARAAVAAATGEKP